jgi:hypothetical protein
MAKNKNFVVSVSGDRSVHDIEKDLGREGFVVDQVLDAIGSITGSADPAIVKRLRAIPGVADVQEPPVIDIGKPGDPETW